MSEEFSLDERIEDDVRIIQHKQSITSQYRFEIPRELTAELREESDYDKEDLELSVAKRCAQIEFEKDYDTIGSPRMVAEKSGLETYTVVCTH